jgi:hypothetical protein
MLIRAVTAPAGVEMDSIRSVMIPHPFWSAPSNQPPVATARGPKSPQRAKLPFLPWKTSD